MAATHTTNLGLNKPGRGDFVSVVSDINDNMDKIDAKFGDIGEDSVADKFTGIDNEIGNTELPTTTQTLTGAIAEHEEDLHGTGGIDDQLSTQSAEISAICQTITGTTNNTGHTINSGEYFIANGGKYQATASIPNGQTWSDKSTAVSDNDIINALNSKMSQKQNINSLFIRASNDGATQAFDISNKGFTNPIFMLTVGYSTKAIVAIVYLNSMSETNIAFEKISGVGDISISSMSYNGSGTINVTFSSNPYRKACLIALNNW